MLRNETEWPAMVLGHMSYRKCRLMPFFTEHACHGFCLWYLIGRGFVQVFTVVRAQTWLLVTAIIGAFMGVLPDIPLLWESFTKVYTLSSWLHWGTGRELFMSHWWFPLFWPTIVHLQLDSWFHVANGAGGWLQSW